MKNSKVKKAPPTVAHKIDDEHLIGMANCMGVEDICKLINIFSDRIMVFDVANKTLHDIDRNYPAGLNGAAIQINVNDQGSD